MKIGKPGSWLFFTTYPKDHYVRWKLFLGELIITFYRRDRGLGG